MKTPWHFYLAYVAMAVGVVATAWRWRRLGTPFRWLGAWFVVLVLQNLVGRLWVHYVDRTSNLIVVNAALPFDTATTMMAVAEFQRQPVARRAVRFAIPLLLVTIGVIFWAFEDPHGYSVLAYPIYYIVAFVATLWALASHALDGEAPALRTGRFYALIALAVYFATGAPLIIFTQYALRTQDTALLAATWALKVDIMIACTFILAGTLVWTRRASSTPSR